ncbi:hypothetical protein K1719_015109 [Acacia pycnantha]|nr:hypothetical protein K1719_015109 [Acacia pycnantha]
MDENRCPHAVLPVALNEGPPQLFLHQELKWDHMTIPAYARKLRPSVQPNHSFAQCSVASGLRRIGREKFEETAKKNLMCSLILSNTTAGSVPCCNCLLFCEEGVD